jgi:hypothetical protein
MRLRIIVGLIAAFVLALAEGVAAQASREATTTAASGSWWGAGVWIGITILLLVGVLIIAYQASKRPNRN